MTAHSFCYAIAVALGLALAAPAPSLAAGGDVDIPHQEWTFAGPFGNFNRAQLQRGFQVYREVCAACHGLTYVSFRNLAQPGGPEFSPEAARVIASEYLVEDGPDDVGDMFERPGILADHFPPPFPNVNAGRAANGGAWPPDLSLIAKARAASSGFPGFILDAVTMYQEQGPDYLYALLTGYGDPPPGIEVPPGQYYNESYLSGTMLAMAPPLADDLVEYSDGTPQTVSQYARDVSAFLMWAAEPHLEERKKTGFRVIVFLLVFAALLYFTTKRLWRDVDARDTS